MGEAWPALTVPGQQCGDVVLVADAELGGAPRGPAAIRKDLAHVRIRCYHCCMLSAAAEHRSVQHIQLCLCSSAVRGENCAIGRRGHCQQGGMNLSMKQQLYL